MAFVDIRAIVESTIHNVDPRDGSASKNGRYGRGINGMTATNSVTILWSTRFLTL